MNLTFFNDRNELRNGWWILIFIGFLVLGFLAFGLLTSLSKSIGMPASWLVPGTFLVSLGATWACTRLRREPLASVGFRMDLRWVKECAWGTALGMAVILLAATMLWLAGGIRFELDPQRSVKGLLYGAYFFTFVALFEENLFRGFLFQRLIDGLGLWPAQAILAVFFGLAHWGNPGMQGATKVWATLDISLAAIFLGLAYLRTGSLALPVGIHLGWNWAQGYLLGFGVSGGKTQGWVKPVFLGKAEWISGGAFGLEASVFGVVAVLLGIALLWMWKGSLKQSEAP